MSSLNFEPGSTVSHFRLEKKLGEGGMGAVFLAEDLTLSRKVAIKFMSRSLVAQQAKPEVREALEVRFIREAKSAAAINHPNVCQIYEADFETDDWYIAMEYIKGKDLIDILEDSSRFTPSEVADTCRQVASGLKYAWNHYKIVHRDVKPRNIMITDEGMAKIVDLGLAKPITGADEENDMPDVTMAGTAIGTPQYMAPEQATGDTNIDFMVDIYALGATLYEMCTGVKAFNERTPTMIYMSQMGKKYKPIREFRTDIPDALIQLIDDMLEPQRDKRIGSYDEILDRIRKMAKAPKTIFDDDDAFDDVTMGLTQIAESIFKDYPEDSMILDRYRVMKKVGQSRAGVVYKCIDNTDGAECAVKSLAPEREFSAKDLPIVRENYKKLIGNTDPNLVHILDVQESTTTGETFVIMERMEGTNLREYTHQLYSESSSLNMRMVVPVLRQVAKAIDHLNDRFGAPHNDIKPESIFIPNDSKEIKLLDYGVTARSLSATTTLLNTKDAHYPLESTDYMAPEKWDHGAVSKQADQYAFALVVYEMLGRRLPFWTNDPDNDPDTSTRSPTKLERARFEKMKKHVMEDTVPAVADMDKNVNAVLLTALSKHPEERFPNCGTFISRLGRAAGVREKSTIIPLLAGAALIIIGAIAFFAYQHSQKVKGCEQQKVAYMDKLKTIEARLSESAIQECLEGARTLKVTADNSLKDRDLEAAAAAYKKAMAALDTAIKAIKAKEASLSTSSSEQHKDLVARIAEFEKETLAKEFFEKELEELNAQQKKILAIKALDIKAARWEPLVAKLKKINTAYSERIANLSAESGKLKANCDTLIGKLREEKLTQRSAEANKLRVTMDDDYSKALKLHDSKVNNPLEVIKKWKKLERDLNSAFTSLNQMRTRYRQLADDAKREYQGTYTTLTKKYGTLIPDQLDKAEASRNKAEKLMLDSDNYNAIGIWQKAVTELDAAEKVLILKADELKRTKEKIKEECAAQRKKINEHVISGDEFLGDADKLQKLAESKDSVPELTIAIKLWSNVSEALSTAKSNHRKKIQAYEKQQAEARVKRRKEIKRISINYPGEYNRIKTHPLGKGLLDKVIVPEKLLASVTNEADDIDTYKALLEAESTLNIAADALKKQITRHLDDQRKKALAMQTNYTNRVDKVLAFAYARDLVKTAESHATLARKAMSAKKYETAAFAWKDAQAALAVAESQLAELQKNEALRKAAMAKHLKTKLDAYRRDFATSVNALSKNDYAKKLLETPLSKADQAEAIAKTGTIEAAIKAWEAAALALKEVEAEVAVWEKAIKDRAAALARKLERESVHAKRAFIDKREILAKSPFAKSRLDSADKLAAQAQKAMTDKKVTEAAGFWKQAMNTLEDLEVDLQASLKTQAEKLRDDVLKHRKAARQWEAWDSTIGEKLIAYDVTMAMARDLMDQQEFMDAGKQLLKCKEILTGVEAFVKTKFVAKPGNDLIIGKVGMQLKWIADLGIWVGTYEVTNAQYRKFKPTHSSRKHEGLTLNGDTQPVCWIGYFDSVAYCTWLTNSSMKDELLPQGYKFRLPTKKEWIYYATCGKTTQKYPWGDKWPPKQGNYANREMFEKNWALHGYTDEFPVTCAVEKSGKNSWGLYGVSGNLWEWTSDRLNGNYAIFGGSWDCTHIKMLQVDLNNKNYADPQRDYDNIGFRVVLEPAKEK